MVTQVMTDIEAIIWEWLTDRKIPFQFQTSLMGGFFALGGAVVDFLLEGNIAIRVMGEYYHRTIEATGHDVIQRETLEGQGYIVVDIQGDDVQDPARLDQAMHLALEGKELL